MLTCLEISKSNIVCLTDTKPSAFSSIAFPPEVEGRTKSQGTKMHLVTVLSKRLMSLCCKSSIHPMLFTPSKCISGVKIPCILLAVDLPSTHLGYRKRWLVCSPMTHAARWSNITRVFLGPMWSGPMETIWISLFRGSPIGGSPFGFSSKTACPSHRLG